MKKHQKILDVLAKVADTVEPVANSRLAACVVYKNDIVSFGVNSKKSHPFAHRFRKNEHAIFFHAEVAAIKNSLRFLTLKELEKSSLYICRTKQVSSEDYTRVYGLSMPCAGCQRCIAEFNLKNVYYTLEGSEFICV